MNLKKNPDIHIIPREIRWNGIIAKEIYRVGFPSIVMQSISSIMTFGMNKILFGFTKTATAVFGAYFKLQSFVFMPVFGLNNGMVPIISYNYGAARMDRVKKAVKLTIATAICIMTLRPGGVPAVPLYTPELLQRLPGDAGDWQHAPCGSSHIHFPLAGFAIIAGSVCQAIGNPVLQPDCLRVPPAGGAAAGGVAAGSDAGVWSWCGWPSSWRQRSSPPLSAAFSCGAPSAPPKRF